MSEPSGHPLPPRLAAVARAIEPGSRVADLGTDHGRLPLWLARTGRAAFCLATERDETLLGRVPRPPAGVAWADRLVYRAGDGLAAVRPQDAVDTIVISGLGARTMVRILSGPSEAFRAACRLVLQPRTDAALVRRWLSTQGWRPISERLTEERRVPHVTIAAERRDDADLYRHPVLDRSDLLVAGPLLVRAPSVGLVRFWRAHYERLAAIVRRGTTGEGRRRAQVDLARAERVLAVISRRGG